jgi:uncharacterized membrane protein YdjX (TVP38/TMEM64 family)
VRSGTLLTWVWLALLVLIGVLWATDPSRFTAGTLERVLGDLGPWSFAAFTAISFVRGALLVPSTPVILAGGALFPGSLLPVLLVSMAGIAASGTLLYRFPGFAGYDSRLVAAYPEQLERLRGQLVRPGAVWFVALWAFFPAVPTDVICYAAGLVRMPYRRMLTGLLLGELPLVTAYVLLGQQAAGWLSR